MAETRAPFASACLILDGLNLEVLQHPLIQRHRIDKNRAWRYPAIIRLQFGNDRQAAWLVPPATLGLPAPLPAAPPDRVLQTCPHAVHDARDGSWVPSALRIACLVKIHYSPRRAARSHTTAGHSASRMRAPSFCFSSSEEPTEQVPVGGETFTQGSGGAQG